MWVNVVLQSYDLIIYGNNLSHTVYNIYFELPNFLSDKALITEVLKYCYKTDIREIPDFHCSGREGFVFIL